MFLRKIIYFVVMISALGFVAFGLVGCRSTGSHSSGNTGGSCCGH